MLLVRRFLQIKVLFMLIIDDSIIDL